MSYHKIPGVSGWLKIRFSGTRATVHLDVFAVTTGAGGQMRWQVSSDSHTEAVEVTLKAGWNRVSQLSLETTDIVWTMSPLDGGAAILKYSVSTSSSVTSDPRTGVMTQKFCEEFTHGDPFATPAVCPTGNKCTLQCPAGFYPATLTFECVAWPRNAEEKEMHMLWFGKVVAPTWWSLVPSAEGNVSGCTPILSVAPTSPTAADLSWPELPAVAKTALLRVLRFPWGQGVARVVKQLPAGTTSVAVEQLVSGDRLQLQLLVGRRGVASPAVPFGEGSALCSACALLGACVVSCLLSLACWMRPLLAPMCVCVCVLPAAPTLLSSLLLSFPLYLLASCQVFGGAPPGGLLPQHQRVR